MKQFLKTILISIITIMLVSAMTVSAGMYFYPEQGGTGTETIPTKGQMLYGTSDGLYTTTSGCSSNQILRWATSTWDCVDENTGVIIDYFLTTTTASVAQTYIMQLTDSGEAEGSIASSTLPQGDDQLLFTFITPSGEALPDTLEAGLYSMHAHFQRTGGNRDTILYWTLTASTTAEAQTLIMTSEDSGEVTSKASFTTHATLSSDYEFSTGDRLLLKIYGDLGLGNNTEITIFTEGTLGSHITILTTSEVLSRIFLRQDGSTPLTANWDVGDFDILNINQVGIGTASPDSILHIKANVPGTVGSHSAGQLIIQNPLDTVWSNVVITAYESDGSGNPDQQLWYLGSSSGSNSDITFLNRRSSSLHLGTSGIARMTILYDGKVGVGTSTPLSLLSVGTTFGSQFLVNTSGVATAEGGFVGDLTGNAATASALAANGANCGAGEYPLGVDASGAVENCTDATTEIDSAIATHLTVVADTNTIGHLNDTDWDTFNNKVSNVTHTGEVTGATALTVVATTSAEWALRITDESGTGVVAFTISPVFTTPNIGSATGSIDGNAGTATTLAGNPTDCVSSETAAYAIDASGNLTCATFYNSLSDMTLTTGYVYVGDSSNNPIATSTLQISNERVGIGTNSPKVKLQINADGPNPQFYITRYGDIAESFGIHLTDTITYITNIQDEATDADLITRWILDSTPQNPGSNTTHAFQWYYNATEIAELDKSGNLQMDGDLTVSGSLICTDCVGDSDVSNTLTASNLVSASAVVDISTETNLVAGTNITLSADTLNVDDAFVLNTSDTMSGTLTLDQLSISAGDNDGIKFWASDSYKIYMRQDYATEHYVGDYNMYFTMTGGTNRGFVFMTGTTPNFQIDASGNIWANNNAAIDGELTVSGDVTIRGNQLEGDRTTGASVAQNEFLWTPASNSQPITRFTIGTQRAQFRMYFAVAESVAPSIYVHSNYAYTNTGLGFKIPFTPDTTATYYVYWRAYANTNSGLYWGFRTYLESTVKENYQPNTNVSQWYARTVNLGTLTAGVEYDIGLLLYQYIGVSGHTAWAHFTHINIYR